MIYKKYEISLSLNGSRVMYIARNSSGVVVFRENSESELIKSIDNFILNQDQKEQLIADKKLEKEKNRVEKDIESENTIDSTSEQTLIPPQKRVTRGPDGKFISKSQLEHEEIKKKTFWDKLTS